MSDDVVVATTDLAEDNDIVNFCEENKIKYFRGSSKDVLKRYYDTAKYFDSHHIVRVTSDCPLVDPSVIDLCIKRYRDLCMDYLRIAVENSFPRGLDTEVFSFAVLEVAHLNAKKKNEREHVTPYMRENKNKNFKVGDMTASSPRYKRNYRMTVDYPEDFELIKRIYDTLYIPGSIIDTKEAISFLDKNRRLAYINFDCIQKPAM